jgi:hypothetical protein
LEGVLDQFQPRLRSAAGHQHFHHIEPEKNIRIIQQPQPGQTALRNAPLLVRMHPGQRTAEFFAAPGFDLHEHQRVVVAANDVDLSAAASTEVSVENFVTAPAQKTAGEFLPERAAPDVLRPGGFLGEPKKVAPPAQTSGDGSGRGRIHEAW